MTETPAPTRRRGRRALVIAAASVTAVVAGATALALLSGLEGRTRTASVPGVREVVVETGAGRVELVGGPGSDVGIRSTLRGGFGSPVALTDVRNGVLTVTGGCTGFAVGCSVDQWLAVPTGVSVRVRAGAGAVMATDLEVPRFEATGGAGSMTLSFRRAPDAILVEAGAGTVDVRVPDVPYRVDARTGVGGASITVTDDPAAPRSLTVRAGVGHVTVGRR